MKHLLIKGKHFQKIFISYLAILLVAALFSSVIYFSDLQYNVKASTQAEQKSDAVYLEEHLNARLESLYSVCGAISKINWVSKAVSGNIPDPFERRNIIHTFSTSFSGGEFYDSVCIVFPEQNAIVTRWGWYAIDEFLRYIKKESSNSMKTSLYEPTRFAFVQQEPIVIQGTSYLWLSQTLPTTSIPRVQVVFLINQRNIEKWLAGVLPNTVSKIQIQDSRGFVVAQAESFQNPSNRTSARNRRITPSSFYGWDYVVSFKENSPLFQIANVILLLTPLLLAGSLLAYILSVNNYRPIQTLLRRVQGDSFPSKGKMTETEFGIIQRYMEQISQSNQAMTKKVKEYRSYAVKGILQQLLCGYFETSEFMERFSDCSLDYEDGTLFCVWLLPVTPRENRGETQLLWDVTKQLFIEECISTSPYDHQSLLTQDGLVFILSDNSGILSDGGMETILEEIEKKRSSVGDATPPIFHGPVENGLVGISISFQYAKEKASLYLFQTSSVPDRSSSGQELDYSYYYPTDWEFQLINNLKIANLDSTVKILDELRMENSRRPLSASAMQSLFHSMRSTIFRVSSELNGSGFDELPLRPFPDSDHDSDSNWEWLYASCREICSRRVYHWPDPENLGEQIITYVNNHFDNPALSLKDIAFHFNISVSMVSHLFKASSNVNFSNYVLRLRMDKAKEILRTESMSLQDISYAVGYENKNSFKRAFLRLEGISPHEYKLKVTGFVGQASQNENENEEENDSEDNDGNENENVNRNRNKKQNENKKENKNEN